MPALHQTKEDILTEFRRTSLLDAARQVFGRCGFAGATMEQIAQDAGVAKGTVYLYYDSKRSIYEAALNAGLAELDAITRRRVESTATLQEAVTAFVTTRAAYFDARRDFFRMYVGEISSRVSGAEAPGTGLGALLDRQVRVLQKAIARAVASGEVRKVDPRAAAMAIFDLTRGLVARRLLTSTHTHIARDAVFIVDLIWKGLERRKEREKR